MVPQDDYLLHLDQNSWGIYKFPLMVGDASPNPHRRQAQSDLGAFRFAREASGGGIQVHGGVTQLTKDGRAMLDKLPVVSWFRIGRAAAPMLLLEALPGYWVSRFRYVGPAKELRTDVDPAFDPSSFLLKRQPQRNRLVQHAISLRQKTWAIKYHRGNLLSALEQAKGNSSSLYGLTVAGAEYAALGHCLYSLLEELADALALLRIIQGLSATPSSFHDLHGKASDLDCDLGEILNKADWYESFRLERANAAHSFGAVVGMNSDSNDLQLWQHPDARIYSGATSPPVPAHEAISHVETLLRGSDILVESLSIYMLGMFHPWDVVTFMHAHPSTPGNPEQVRVWVREVSFFDGAEKPAAWTLLDKDGVIRVTTDERGGLVSPESHQ
jgi:hypothetical protein